MTPEVEGERSTQFDHGAASENNSKGNGLLEIAYSVRMSRRERISNEIINRKWKLKK